MRFLDFKEKFADFTVLSLSDIRTVKPDFNVVQLSQWQEKGYITKLIKSKYIFSDLELNEQKMFLIANELLDPSYVSLESALHWYGLIPEGVYKVTSVATRRTQDYETKVGNFEYRAIKSSAFFGDALEKIGERGHEYRIASPEKALADYFYYNEASSKEDITSLRLNPEFLREKVNYNTLAKYALAMDNKELIRRINLLMEVHPHD